jgi:hypothetical protein
MNEKIYILTDLCMWESNKQDKKNSPHAIQVVDIETGQVRYIKSGAKITFVEGEISEPHSQENYNKVSPQMSNNIKKQLPRTKSKAGGRQKNKSLSKNKSV